MLHATDPPWRTLSAYGGRLLELVEQLESSLPLPTGSARGEHGIGRGVRIARRARLAHVGKRLERDLHRSDSLKRVGSAMTATRNTCTAPPSRHPIALGLESIHSPQHGANRVTNAWPMRHVENSVRAGLVMRFSPWRVAISNRASLRPFSETVNGTQTNPLHQNTWPCGPVGQLFSGP